MDTLYAASHWDELKLFVYEIDAREYLMETFGMTKEEAQENIWEIPAKHLGKEKEANEIT